MIKLYFTVLIFWMLFVGNLFAQSPEKTFYISPDGSDKNPGTIEKPFASPEKVLEVIAGSSEERFVVYFRGGIYFRNKSLYIDNSSVSVSFQAYKEEKVVFHGGKKLNGDKFRKTTNKALLERMLPEARGKVWEISLKGNGLKDYGTLKQHGFGTPVDVTPLELFVDGEPQCLARYPNEGRLAIGKIYDTGSIPRRGDYSNRGGEFGFEYDRPQRWKKAKNIWLHGKFSYGYNDDHLQIERIDYDQKSFKVSSPHLYGIRTSTEKYVDPDSFMDKEGLSVRGYYAYNLLEEIDEPGEYFLDRQTGKLYLYPEKELSSATVEVSVLESPFFSLKKAANISVSGMTFTCVRGMAILMEACQDISITDCEFSNLGTVAISMGQQLRQNKPSYNADGSPKQEIKLPGNFENVVINQCKIFNTGTGGIIMSGGNRKELIPGNNKVINTEFFSNERVNQTYSPSVRLSGVGNIIQNCYFHDLDHQAIGFMGNDHLIAYNRFDKVCTDADDMGPIYTGRDPGSRGTVIEYNYFSNIEPQHHDTKMCGVYIDDGSGGMTIRNNFFFKVGNPGRKGGFGAVFFHGGHDNIVDGNIFMDCKVAVGHAPWNDKRWAESLKKPLQTKRLKEDVDIMSDVYQQRYPELKNYFTDFGKRLNYVKKNIFIRTQSIQRGDFSLNQNLSCGHGGNAPENIDYSEAEYFFKTIEPFPFDKVGIRKY